VSGTAPADRPTGRAAVAALATDALLVVLFAVIGRASHAEPLSPSGVAATAWPFLVSLGGGWLALLAWRAPARPVRTGLGVWAITVAGGMLLRAVTGAGVAVPFVVVAAVTLLVLLVGWRLLVAGVRRRRASTGP